jgi:hypothetical protein
MAQAFDSSDVNKAIRHGVWTDLKERGFIDHTARTAWRRWEGGVDAINFQSFNRYLADGVGCTTYSFALNMGILLDAVPNYPKTDPARPREHQCHLRLHLHKHLSQPFFHPYTAVRAEDRQTAGDGVQAGQATDRADVWYVEPDGRNLDTCISDALTVIVGAGLDWFENARDPRKLLWQLTHGGRFDHLGRPGSATHSFVVGFVALAAGESGLAREHLSRLRESAFYPIHRDAIGAALEE